MLREMSEVGTSRFFMYPHNQAQKDSEGTMLFNYLTIE